MLVGRLTHLAELNISHVPCVQGVFGAVNSGSCKNPILDDRRIATGVLYERMKHIAGCDLRLYVDVCEGAQDAACHPVKLLTDRARGRLRRDNTAI